jgi:hypothetical protein
MREARGVSDECEAAFLRGRMDAMKTIVVIPRGKKYWVEEVCQVMWRFLAPLAV